MRLLLVDPSAYTPPYDHALATALGRAGTDVTVATSRFAYGAVPPADGYRRDERAFYRRQPGSPGSWARLVSKLAQHAPDMLRLRVGAARAADVVHYQWLAVPHLDALLLPRGPPVVLTAHDVLPREPRPGQLAAQRRLYHRVDAIVVHSENGRARLEREVGVAPNKIEVIGHGAFAHLAEQPDAAPLPPELAGGDPELPVVLFFGLLRPYKGLDVLLEAWRRMPAEPAAELWIVGNPRMDTSALRTAAPPGVRFLERFVGDAELPALFRRAALAVLPYREIDQSGVLATALAFATPLVLSAVGGFPEVAAEGAARLVAPGDPTALRDALAGLLADPAERARLSEQARRLTATTLSWDEVARRHLALYHRLR